jgi:hypothetical protein
MAALADAVQRIAQAHHGGGLAFAGRRRADRGDQHQLAVGPLAPEFAMVPVNDQAVTCLRPIDRCYASKRLSFTTQQTDEACQAPTSMLLIS